MRSTAIAIAFALSSLASSDAAFAICGSDGGPGFRNERGACVGWKALKRVCGEPATTRCTYEGGGIGDTGKEKGEALPGSMALPFVGAATGTQSFDKREVKRDGIACTSQSTVARVAACVMGKGQADCKADVEQTLSKGECTRLTAGTEVRIVAGSRSFDWVRFQPLGSRPEMWAERNLVLD